MIGLTRYSKNDKPYARLLLMKRKKTCSGTVARKKTTLTSAPSILSVQVNRQKNNSKSNKLCKKTIRCSSVLFIEPLFHVGMMPF